VTSVDLKWQIRYADRLGGGVSGYAGSPEFLAILTENTPCKIKKKLNRSADL
jgi:hypothetical protein